MTTEPETEEKRSGAIAVDRALAIVETLEANPGAMSLADLSRATGLYKSTLLRLLASLERSTLVVREASQKYALGPFAFRLGRAYEATHNLERYLRPLMQALVDAGTESPSFHVWHSADKRLCLLRIDSHHSTLDRLRSGDLLPIDRGAPGKVLAAFRHAPRGIEDIALIHTSFGERDPACASLSLPVSGRAAPWWGHCPCPARASVSRPKPWSG